jgi:hypothetical protein
MKEANQTHSGPIAEPNALVVFLPRPPEHICSDAVLGGDWIARGRRWNTLDKR